jgi:hypothetical protein
MAAETPSIVTGLLLVRHDVPDGVHRDDDVRDHPAHDWRAGVAQQMGHQQPLELLGRRRQRRQSLSHLEGGNALLLPPRE